MADSIHQVITFDASPQRVYSVLLDSGQFRELTDGAAADIGQEPGSPFTCFNGMISGRNIELIRNQRLVQAWRVANWPEGVYSIVRFELEPQESGTKLTFVQAGFPEDSREHLEIGWHRMYWEPIKAYLG